MKNKLKFSILLIIIVGLTVGTIFNRGAEALVPKVNTLVSVNNTGNGQGGNGNSPFGDSFMLSANGKYVVFSSIATNLVTGDTNAKTDIFVRNIETNTTSRVNVSSSGVQANNDAGSYGGEVVISETGRYIAFTSRATNLMDGETIPGGPTQIYLRDTVTNTTSIVTRKSDGTLGNGDYARVRGVSNDGRFITWRGSANTNLTPGGSSSAILKLVYVADMQTRAFTLVNPLAGSTSSVGEPYISCDGTLIVFSTNEQLIGTDTDTTDDVYIVDVRNGITKKKMTNSSSSSKVANNPNIS